MKMQDKCPLCGAKMKYVADGLTLDDGSRTRECECENGHEFVEKTVLGVKADNWSDGFYRKIIVNHKVSY